MDDKMITSKAELSQALRRINDRIIIVPAKTKKLERYSGTTSGGTGSDTTLDHYYVEMINDTLDEIRAGEVAYIFNARQIADILCFEPRAEFTYEDEAIAVRLSA